GRAVVDTGSVARSNRAVFLECGLESTQSLGSGVLARTFVLVEDNGGLAFLLCRDLNRNNLGFEVALSLRGDGLAMGVDGELVLLFAGDAVFLGDVLAGQAHMVVVVNIPEAVMDHGIDQLSVAQSISL